jgi:hypothetical protein
MGGFRRGIEPEPATGLSRSRHPEVDGNDAQVADAGTGCPQLLGKASHPFDYLVEVQLAIKAFPESLPPIRCKNIDAES